MFAAYFFERVGLKVSGVRDTILLSRFAAAWKSKFHPLTGVELGEILIVDGFTF